MEMTLIDLKDVTTVRILIENEALTQSIQNGDDHWESGIVASFHSLSKLENSTDKKNTDDLETRNFSFHNALLAANHSKRLQKFNLTLYDQHKRYRNMARGANDAKRDIHAEHKALYEAALAKDIKAATEANEFHIRKTAEVVMLLKDGEWDI